MQNSEMQNSRMQKSQMQNTCRTQRCSAQMQNRVMQKSQMQNSVVVIVVSGPARLAACAVPRARVGHRTVSPPRAVNWLARLATRAVSCG
eukprot:8871015-Lingulodinium_polyedra.AAC.1